MGEDNSREGEGGREGRKEREGRVSIEQDVFAV